MSEPPSPPQPPTGVGFGLRWDFLDDLMGRLAEGTFEGPPFLEVSPENYMRRGGYIPDSLAFVAEHVPLITHGLMMSIGGTDPFDPRYFEELRAFAHRYRTPWHSDHLCFSGVDGRILHDLLPLPQTEAAARHVAARVREARDRLEVPMAVENISYYLQLGAPELEETEFISLILEEADCGLLLDVNNVYVNGQNHGFDAKAWIDRIDVRRVVQLHVAGHEFREGDGLIIDTHGAPVIDPVYELLEHTIERLGPTAVILERDNDVPDLDTMLAERERLQAAYDRGLERHVASLEQKRAQPPTRPYELAPVHALFRVLDHAARTTDDAAIQAAMQAGYPDLELAPKDADALRTTELSRVRVYRRLVRGNLVEAIENQLPRTVARLGEDTYHRYVRRFCEEELPISQILRDVPYEWARWAMPLLAEEQPAYLADLARYELFEFDVYTAERHAPELRADELLADAPIAFDGSVRVARFDHRVHELVDDSEDRTVPKPEACGVLAYRDMEGEYRELDLTPLATAILTRLVSGEPFAAAVQSACARRGVTIDSAVIQGTSEVLADLGERGAVLGALHAPVPDPSPFFRWLTGERTIDDGKGEPRVEA